MKRCAPIVGLASALLVLLLFLTPAPIAQATAAPFAQQAPRVPASTAPLPRLPMIAQSLVSATLGRDTPGYRATAAADGYGFDNAAQQLTAEFDMNGLRVSAGEFTFGLALQAYGYAPSLHSVLPTEPLAAANRVEYRRGDLTEWYVNGPLGVEQGFTLAQPPAGDRQDALMLSLIWSGNLDATVEEGGTGLILRQGTMLTSLRYTGLAAYDATGRELRAWLELDRSGQTSSVLLRVEDAEARYPLTIDPYVLQATLTNSGAASGDALGVSMAMSADGSTLVVGATVVNSGQGAAYVFAKGGSGSWATTGVPTAILANSGGAANDHLGFSVAISADGATIVAGAYGVDTGTLLDTGAAYVFARGGAGSWANTGSPTAILTKSGGAQYDSLGGSVAVSADGATVVAGAWGVNSSRGAAYVFARGGSGSWTTVDVPTAILTNFLGASGDILGASTAVSADGSIVVAGAYGVNGFSGAAYVFAKGGAGNWTDISVPTAILTNSLGAANDSLGYSVAVSADGATVAAGAFAVNGGRGAAYVFARGGSGSWANTDSPAATLTDSGGAANDYFGNSVAISADGATVVAGAKRVNSSRGAAYVFAKGGSWATTATPTATLTDSGGAASSFLGYSVAASANGSTVAAGAAGVNSNRGAVYVFFQPTSNANLSHLSLSSGTLNPTFAAGTTSYSATVANGITSLTVTPTAADATATIQVRINGGSYAAVASGSASGALALNVGDNTIAVPVTAQDGTTTKTYTVTVTRAPSSNASSLLYLPLLLR